jgi:tetratricopeptide (TPR) repeat protein
MTSGRRFNDVRIRLRRLNQTTLKLYNSSDYGAALVKAIEAGDLAMHMPKSDPEVLSALMNLAGIQETRAEYGDAESAWCSIRELPPELGDEGHDLQNDVLGHLGSIYASQGKDDKAEEMYRELVEHQIVKLGPKHSEYLTTLNNLAVICGNRGKYEEVENLLKCVASARSEVLGPKHPETAAALNNLAVLYHKTERYVEAEASLSHALEILAATVGTEHPNYQTSLASLRV